MVSWPEAVARRLAADGPFVFEGPTTIGWLPDSRRVIVSGTPRSGGPPRLLMLDTITGTAIQLAAGKDAETHPVVSPDGGRIAFVSRGWDSDLVRLPIDGGAPVPLIATLQSETFPDMLPSGLLAYVTNAGGAQAIRLRSPGESWSRPLDVGAALGDVGMAEVRLSPDGQRAAFSSVAGDHLIWVVPTAGGAPVRLDAETTDQHGPSWSPDGNWIAYRRLLDGAWSIVKRPLGGGAAVRLDEALPGAGQSDWSADGKWIAHARLDGMHLVPPDGSPIRVIADLRGPISAFRFSRDGSRLFAVRRGQQREWQLVIRDVAADRQLEVVTLPIAAAANVNFMTLTADEAHILINVTMNRSDIWLLEGFDPPVAWWERWMPR